MFKQGWLSREERGVGWRWCLPFWGDVGLVFFSPDPIFGARKRKEVFLRRVCSSRRHRWGRSGLDAEREEQGGRRGPVHGLVLQGKGRRGLREASARGSVGGGAGRGWGPKPGDNGYEEAGARGDQV